MSKDLTESSISIQNIKELLSNNEKSNDSLENQPEETEKDDVIMLRATVEQEAIDTLLDEAYESPENTDPIKMLYSSYQSEELDIVDLKEIKILKGDYKKRVKSLKNNLWKTNKRSMSRSGSDYSHAKSINPKKMRFKRKNHTSPTLNRKKGKIRKGSSYSNKYVQSYSPMLGGWSANLTFTDSELRKMVDNRKHHLKLKASNFLKRNENYRYQRKKGNLKQHKHVHSPKSKGYMCFRRGHIPKLEKASKTIPCSDFSDHHMDKTRILRNINPETLSQRFEDVSSIVERTLFNESDRFSQKKQKKPVHRHLKVKTTMNKQQLSIEDFVPYKGIDYVKKSLYRSNNPFGFHKTAKSSEDAPFEPSAEEMSKQHTESKEKQNGDENVDSGSVSSRVQKLRKMSNVGSLRRSGQGKATNAKWTDLFSWNSTLLSKTDADNINQNRFNNRQDWERNLKKILSTTNELSTKKNTLQMNFQKSIIRSRNLNRSRTRPQSSTNGQKNSTISQQFRKISMKFHKLTRARNKSTGIGAIENKKQTTSTDYYGYNRVKSFENKKNPTLVLQKAVDNSFKRRPKFIFEHKRNKTRPPKSVVMYKR